MSVFPEDRELLWILVDYLKNNGERKGHQCTDSTSKSGFFFQKAHAIMNHRLHSFALSSGLSSGAGLQPGESTEMGSYLSGVQPAGDTYPHLYDLCPVPSWSSWPSVLGQAGLEGHPSSGAASDVTQGRALDSLSKLACVTPSGMCRSHFQALACKQQFQELFSF